MPETEKLPVENIDPNAQDGKPVVTLIGSDMSDYALLASEHASLEPGAPDSDLLAAARLLVPTQEAEAIPRLNAAAEALQSYEGRLARGYASNPKGLGVMLDELAL